MASSTPVDANVVREEVKAKYREVAVDPHGDFHFHTGRFLARRSKYDSALVDAMPDAAVESFAGIGNPFILCNLEAGERVVDIGSGGGFDCFYAAGQVGPTGHVVGIDMTEEMLGKSRASAQAMGLDYVEVKEGLVEAMPVDDASVDAVISNGVINLCPDKEQVFTEIHRVLKPGGRVQFTDIANGASVPDSARSNVDLWTA